MSASTSGLTLRRPVTNHSAALGWTRRWQIAGTRLVVYAREGEGYYVVGVGGHAREWVHRNGLRRRYFAVRRQLLETVRAMAAADPIPAGSPLAQAKLVRRAAGRHETPCGTYHAERCGDGSWLVTSRPGHWRRCWALEPTLHDVRLTVAEWQAKDSLGR